MPLQTDHLDIPFWQKYTMTIEEAAAYFHTRKNAHESTCSRKSICTICTNGGESGSNKEKII